MPIKDQSEAVRHIKEKYNFRRALEGGTNSPQPAYFTGQPTIISEEHIEGRKVWQYSWPEEADTVMWLLDDGQNITSEADVRPTIELQKSSPDFKPE